MKKTISILLVFVMVLSLCACGSGSNANSTNSKYVGKYQHERETDTAGLEEMTLFLNADGTGTYERFAPDTIRMGWPSSCTLESSTLKWEVDENEYITIYYSGKKYYQAEDDYGGKVAYVPEGIDTSYSVVYEIKGNQLYEVGNNNAAFTKVN